MTWITWSYNAAFALLAPWLTLRDTNLGRVMSTCVRAAAGVYAYVYV